MSKYLKDNEECFKDYLHYKKVCKPLISFPLLNLKNIQRDNVNLEDLSHILNYYSLINTVQDCLTLRKRYTEECLLQKGLISDQKHEYYMEMLEYLISLKIAQSFDIPRIKKILEMLKENSSQKGLESLKIKELDEDLTQKINLTRGNISINEVAYPQLSLLQFLMSNIPNVMNMCKELNFIGCVFELEEIKNKLESIYQENELNFIDLIKKEFQKYQVFSNNYSLEFQKDLSEVQKESPWFKKSFTEIMSNRRRDEVYKLYRLDNLYILDRYLGTELMEKRLFPDNPEIRVDILPFVIYEYYPNSKEGVVKYEFHLNERGEYHNPKGPAILKRYKNGNVNEEYYFLDGKPKVVTDRKNNYFYRKFFKDGGINKIITFRDGKEDTKEYYKTGDLLSQQTIDLDTGEKRIMRFERKK